MSRVYLRLPQVYEYVKGEINSPNMKEGEEVLKSEHIVMIGFTEKSGNKTRIRSHVSQTSAPSSGRYTIEGSLLIENSKATIEKMKCSCKSGAAGDCKHAVAVLLHMERNDILTLKLAPKKTSGGVTEITNEMNRSFQGIGNSSDSGLSKHAQGPSTRISNENQRVVTTDSTEAIFKKVLENKTLEKVEALSSDGIKKCCMSTFESLATTDPLELCRNTLQGHENEAWIKARELRITASRIYGIYTYIKNKTPDWEEKSMKYFWPEKFTNKYVEHGINNEQLARQTYESKAKVTVVQCGFIVHPEHQWTGVSPDGLVFGESGPEKLIEIKCVYLGKDKSINECLSLCNFLEKKNDKWDIKKKHTYYGQIQLGMLLCNVKKCDFIVFASFDKSIKVIPVPFDEKFALDMFTVVREAYFKKMLHYICLRKKRYQGQSKAVSSMAQKLEKVL